VANHIHSAAIHRESERDLGRHRRNANGTIDGTGLYTAPAQVPNPVTVTVTATTPSSSGSAFVTVATPTALGSLQITVTATVASGTAYSDLVTLVVK
jgi:hypothetical protein